MRDFLDYVERSKEDSPNSLDFYMEGFLSDISKMEGANPVHAFILGFIAGKGVNLSANSQYVMKLITGDQGITSASQAVANIRDLEGEEAKDLRASLASTLSILRTIVKDHKKKQEDLDMQPTLFDTEKYRKKA